MPLDAGPFDARPFDAVLWDMDGTLVDTEPAWIEVEHEIAAEHGATWSHEQALALVGQDLLTSGAVIVEQMGLDLTPQQVVDRLLDGVVAKVRDQVTWRPGARELLARLRADGVPCGLVTMSWTRFVEPILAQLPEGTFAAVVTGDQVSRGKPDPEAYLTAARRLGVDPTRCLAIEDSAAGTASAVAAGCTTLVVPLHVPVPPGPGRVFAESLTDVDLTALAPAAR